MTNKILLAAVMGVTMMGIGGCEGSATAATDSSATLNKASDIKSTDKALAQKTAKSVENKAKPYDPVKYAFDRTHVDVMPTDHINAKAYFNTPYDDSDKVKLKRPKFVPFETFNNDYDDFNDSKGLKAGAPIESCDGAGKKSIFCQDGYLLQMQHSLNRVALPDGGFVVLELGLKSNSWYSLTLSYIKDGVVYPTPWFFNHDSFLTVSAKTLPNGEWAAERTAPYFAQVNGDYCIYAQAMYHNKNLPTQYNCFNVNPDYKDSKDSAPKLILTKQTADHGVIGLSTDNMDETNIHEFHQLGPMFYEEYAELIE